MPSELILLVVLGILFALLVSGTWIGVSLAITGTVGLYLFTGYPPEVMLGWITWNTNNSFSLCALPLFIFMGELLYRGKISSQLFSGLSPWITWLPGRLLHCNILGCSMFAAISGSSAATAATIGKVNLPEFEKRGYDSGLSIGSLAGAGTLGFLIPPSLIMIVYGTIVGESIGQLFMAGLAPGIMIAMLFTLYIVVITLIYPKKVPADEAELYSWQDRFKSLLEIGPVALLIGLVLGSIYIGWATATEAAAIGVAGSILIGFAQRQLNWERFKESLFGAVRTTSMVILIMTGAALLSTTMGYLRVPAKVAELITAWGLSPYAVLAIFAIFYLFLGCLFDGFSMLVMTLPIVYPVIIGMGFHPVWFGVYLVILIEIAQITPPVGFNLFIIQGLTGRSIGYIMAVAIPFFILMLIGLVIITIVPDIVLWLPNHMFKLR